MKVLVIASNVSKTPSGTLYPFIFDEIYRLAKRSIEVHVVRSKIERNEYLHNIHFYGLERGIRIDETLSYIQKLIRNIPLGLFRNPSVVYLEGKYYNRVAKIAEIFKVDIIHAHFVYPEGVTGYLAKVKTKRPLVITAHGYDLQSVPEIKYGARLHLHIDHLIRKVINNADAVIVPSRRMYEIAKGLTNEPQKVFLVYNGVDINVFHPNIDRSVIRNALKMEKDEVVIFTARHLYPVHGIEYLIRATPEVVKCYDRVRVIIAGEGPLKDYLHQLAYKLGVKKFVMFTGRVPRTLMPFYLAAADIACLPSLMEGLPIFLLESLASGKPVVATRVGGIPEAVTDGYNGYLVKPKDPQGLASALLKLVLSPARIKTFGQHSRSLAEKKFDIEKRINNIINIYSTLSPR